MGQYVGNGVWQSFARAPLDFTAASFFLPAPLVGALRSATSTISQLFCVSLGLFPIISDDIPGIESPSVGGYRLLSGEPNWERVH